MMQDETTEAFAAANPTFHAGMTVHRALRTHPNARWVFSAYHLGGCSSCAISEQETLAEVAAGYGVNLEKLIDDLNALLEPIPEIENPPA